MMCPEQTTSTPPQTWAWGLLASAFVLVVVGTFPAQPEVKAAQLSATTKVQGHALLGRAILGSPIARTSMVSRPATSEQPEVVTAAEDWPLVGTATLTGPISERSQGPWFLAGFSAMATSIALGIWVMHRQRQEKQVAMTYMTGAWDSPKETAIQLFAGNDDAQPEPQKQNNASQRRWDDLPPHPSTAQTIEGPRTFRTAVVQWLQWARNKGIVETSTKTKEQVKETTSWEQMPQSKMEQKEYFVDAKTWDPAVVSDPVAAAREVTAEELEDDKLLALLLYKRDEELNILAWKCLGYRYVAIGSSYAWDTSRVFPKWRARYPIPPDLVGITGYTAETIAAVEFLVQTTAEEYHDAVERYSKSQGLRYSSKHVAPGTVRKVQVTQFLMYYRDEFFGVPMEELLRRKQQHVQEQKKKQLDLLRQRARDLGITLEEMLEREERKKKRQRLAKLREQRERDSLLPQSPL